MTGLTYKKQFIILCCAFALSLVLVMFLLWPWLSKMQSGNVASAITARRQLAEKRAQQENLRKAEASMEELQSLPLKYQDLLPTESRLVAEIAMLEKWAVDLNLEFRIALSGKVKEAKKADTRSDIALVPVTLTLKGQSADVLSFLEILESSSFPVVANTLVMSSDGTSKLGGVFVTLTGAVYIKR